MAENYGVLLQWLIFLGVAFTSILGSVLVITQKNPIHSALFLGPHFCLCGGPLLLALQPVHRESSKSLCTPGRLRCSSFL